MTVIEPKWELGNWLVFDVDNARKIMRLGYLEAMKEFGIYDGNYYTFAKDAFNKTDLKMADACAKIFDMDASILYTKDIFIKKLGNIIDDSAADLKDAIAKLKHLGSKFITLQDVIKSAKEAAHTHILCILIAQNLKEKGKDSIFAKKAAAKLIPEAVLAAKFLVKYELV